MSPAAIGAQQGVGDGVQQHVAVGVAGEALGVFERESADAQGDAWLEFVRVIAKSDACIHGLPCLFFESLLQGYVLARSSKQPQVLRLALLAQNDSVDHPAFSGLAGGDRTRPTPGRPAA